MRLNRSQIDALIEETIEEAFLDRSRRLMRVTGPEAKDLNCDFSEIPDSAFMSLLVVFPGLFYKNSMADTAILISKDSPELKMTDAQVEKFRAAARSKFTSTDIPKLKKTLETVLTLSLGASAYLVCSTIVAVSKILISIIGVFESDPPAEDKQVAQDGTPEAAASTLDGILAQVGAKVKEFILFNHRDRETVIEKLEPQSFYIFPSVCLKLSKGEDASSYLDTRRLIFDNVVATSISSSSDFYSEISNYYDDMPDSTLKQEIEEIIKGLIQVDIPADATEKLVRQSEDAYEDIKRYL